MTTEKRNLNLELLSSPAKWPHWPYLPLVNRRDAQGPARIGVVCARSTMAHDDELLFAEGVNLWSLSSAVMPKFEKTTAQKLDADGWEVD